MCRLWKKAADTLINRIIAIFPKRKYKRIDVEEAGHEFHALTPIDNADLGIYESALDFVFANDNLKNIAISGAYGAGKSTVIESYKKKHPDNDFLHISLTCFRPENKEIGNKNDDVSTNYERGNLSSGTNDTVLEGKILNQLIHQIPVEKIPHTNFRVKKEASGGKSIGTTFFAIIGLVLVVYVLYFSRWVRFVDSLTVDTLKNILNFSTHSDAQFVAGVVMVIIIGIFIYRIVKLLENHSIVKKATINGLEIEIFKDSNDSYFDKYLNEILYLFREIEENAIVFEDIDRYDSSIIFERLHEVNKLLNNNRKGKPPLRFFFLLKDDIFISKDRTKFFDFIIPVVPVIDSSNSFDKFLECLEKNGIVVENKNGNKLNGEFLQGISLYIDDMRLLQNICNKYFIYHSRISTIEQDENKMFALITYKNLFPCDFSGLQLGQGFIFEIIGGRGKEYLMEMMNSRIKSKNEELMNVKAELLTTDELAIIYGQKIDNTSSSYYRKSADAYRQLINSHKGDTAIIAEYNKRIIYAENNFEYRDNHIISLEKEILELNNELAGFLEKKMCELITRKNIDYFFANIIFTSETGDSESFKGIKDSPYFAMLKYLVREGYIDETYSDYITYFYEKSLKRTDKIFLRSVTDKKAKEAVYELDNPSLIASRLPLVYFDQEEVLNYSLFDFLLSDFFGEKEHVLKTERFIKQIRDKERFEFLMNYAASIASMSNFVRFIGMKWQDFFNDYFVYFGIGKIPSKNESMHGVFIKRFALELFLLVGMNTKRMSFIGKKSKPILVEYISNDADFLDTDTAKTKEVAIGIKQFEIEFVAINAKTANRELLRLIYENNSYVINYENILAMLQKFYISIELDSLPSNGYTIIMSNEVSPLANYVNTNINDYVGVVIENCKGIICDSEKYALSIINNEAIEKKKRIIYVSYLNTVISDLHEINNMDIWGELLRNDKALEYTAKNVVAYFSNCCIEIFDKILTSFINAKETSIILDGSFVDEQEKNDFVDAMVLACALDNAIYEGYIEQLDFRYDNFEIKDLCTEKLSILDKHNKIRMTVRSLETIRTHYTKYLYAFILNHLEEYINIVSDKTIFRSEEMLMLLDEKIMVERKIELLRLTQEKVSIDGERYPDKLSAFILNNNYDAGDFEYLVSNYETFGQQSKMIILNKAIQQINLLHVILHKASRLLIHDLLLSDNIGLDDKYEIFKITAPKTSKDEIKTWLSMVDLDIFLPLYEERKRPTFEKTDINVAVLEILKKRGDIADFTLDENNGRYKTSKHKVF